MIYIKEPCNMLVVAIFIYWFIFSVAHGIMQGKKFYEDNDQW